MYFFLFSLGVTLLVAGVSYHLFVNTVHRVSYKPERLELIRAEQARFKLDPQAREISFTTQDGVTIAGVLFVRPRAQRNIIICHGHKSAKEMTRPIIDMFPQDNILIFDFRAHGQSGGSLTTFGYNERLEVQAAVKFLKTIPDAQGLPVYGIGVSMGAASLLHAAAHGVLFAALVLDSSFSSLQKEIDGAFFSRTGLPSFLFKHVVVWLFEHEAGFSLAEFNPCDDISWVTSPVLIIHARDDSIVPFEHAQDLYECAGGKKESWFIEHAYHGRISKELWQDYARRVHAFFGESADTL